MTQIKAANTSVLDSARCLIAFRDRTGDERELAGAVIVATFMANVNALIDSFRK